LFPPLPLLTIPYSLFITHMTFIDVVLEPDAELAEDLYLRFKLVEGTQSGPVTRVRYTSDEGLSGEWRVEGRAEQGTLVVATVAKVEDSSAGVSMLVMGGLHGVRLSLIGGEATVVLPYLLLSEEDILGN
jgi:hypothetical protein